MRKFICPYCNEDHTEEDMRNHYIFLHEMSLQEAPSNFEEYEKRFSILGLVRYIGEDDDSE